MRKRTLLTVFALLLAGLLLHQACAADSGAAPNPYHLRRRTFECTVPVTDTHAATLYITCEVEGDDTWWQLERVVGVRLEPQGFACFRGEVYVNVEGPWSLYWHINGDLFEQGTMTNSDNRQEGEGFAAFYETQAVMGEWTYTDRYNRVDLRINPHW